MNSDEIILLPQPSKEDLQDANEALKFACLYTKPLLDVAPQSTQSETYGTGVLIGIERRLFVATAAHCLKREPILLLNSDPIRTPFQPSPYLKKVRSCGLDVGLLEIENQSSINRLPIECLCPNTPPIPTDAATYLSRLGCIVGCPYAEYVRRHGSTGISTTNFGTYPVAASEIEYEYSYPVGVGRWQQETGVILERELNFTPHGYSGSGVWAFNKPQTDRLILPKHYLTLYAIQSAWRERRRVVVCVPIKHWIQLVYNNYPDLQEPLSAQFPFLRE